MSERSRYGKPIPDKALPSAGEVRRTHMTAIHLQPCHDSSHALRRHAAIDALNDATGWAFATLRAAVREWRRRSRDRAELAALDDRTLADIGLTRGDAEFLIN